MHTIPFIDIRQSGPVELARLHRETARQLIAASHRTLGLASQIASPLILPVADRMARAWLEKTRNPFTPEIAAIADILDVSGVWALNLASEWGCTSGAYPSGETMALSRILDWPFPELGKHLVVTHQRGKAGDFHNITWPGLSGVLTGMAEGRFSVTLNMAPMRRSNWSMPVDWLKNRRRMFRSHGLPPMHLLRQVMEEAKSYEEAKFRLADTLLCVPVIYILAGTRPGEGCVIERTETDTVIREPGADGSVCAANHFESRLNGQGGGWSPRPIESHARSHHASRMEPHRIGADLDWFESPSANELSRVVVYANAAEGRLSVMGTDGVTPVTSIFKV